MIVFGRNPHCDVNRSHVPMNRRAGVAMIRRSPRLTRGPRRARKYASRRPTNSHASYRRATAETIAIAARGCRHFTGRGLWNSR